MDLSRATFARIEAAAIERLMESPFIIVWKGIPMSFQALPSIRRYNDCVPTDGFFG